MRLLCWKSTYYNSLELCSVSGVREGLRVISHIDRENGTPVDYELLLDAEWVVWRFMVECGHGDRSFVVKGERGASGRWTINGKTEPLFDGCAYIDISLTPFTNSLPVRHLRLAVGEQQQIAVVYIDLDERTVTPKKQRYACVAANRYRFETIPNDFEAEIRFGEDGFVEHYPGLFEREACEP